MRMLALLAAATLSVLAGGCSRGQEEEILKEIAASTKENAATTKQILATLTEIKGVIGKLDYAPSLQAISDKLSLVDVDLKAQKKSAFAIPVPIDTPDGTPLQKICTQFGYEHAGRAIPAGAPGDGRWIVCYN